MKTTLLICTAALLLCGATVDSQTPETSLPNTPLAALQTIKEKNATMIASQQKTLATLDQLSKDSAQLKNFTRRL